MRKIASALNMQAHGLLAAHCRECVKFGKNDTIPWMRKIPGCLSRRIFNRLDWSAVSSVPKLRIMSIFLIVMVTGLMGLEIQTSALAAESPVVVFLGDSLTAGGRWADWFPAIKAKNQGIPGETTRHIRNRLDRVTSFSPQIILMMAGINDLGAGRSTADILTDTRKIILELERSLPGARIVVQSILPVNRYKFGSGIDNKTIRNVNRELAETAETLGVDFLDLTGAMADDEGELEAGYTWDGVHLTAAGYRSWRLEISRHMGWQVNVSGNPKE